MKSIISQNDSFVREASLQPIEALDGCFSLKFVSVLLDAKEPNASRRNFEAILDLEGLVSLQRLLDVALRG